MKIINAKEHLGISPETDDNDDTGFNIGYVVTYGDDCPDVSSIYQSEEDATGYAAQCKVGHGWDTVVCKLVPVARVV